jgi:Tfp pilus assembly protein PilO
MNKNVTAAILIILAIGVYITFTKGQISEAQQIRTVNGQYASAIKNAERLISARDQVLKNYRDISEDDRERLDKMIPDTVDNIRLIIDLNSVALRHGFSLRNIKASTAAEPRAATADSVIAETGSIPDPVLDTVTVTFGVTAPYQEFISFMQDLEASLRVIDLSRLTMATTESGTYDFGVELKTYWLRQ